MVALSVQNGFDYPTLSYWCFNPGLAMEKLKDLGVRGNQAVTCLTVYLHCCDVLLSGMLLRMLVSQPT
jgi:hypothetical protein